MSKYFRTMGGKVVHLSTCRYAVPGPYAGPWQWADGFGAHLVRLMVQDHGYKQCGVCKPFGDIS